MSVTTYYPPSGAVIKSTSCFLDGARLPVPVHLMQYDDGTPVLAVKLYEAGQEYEIPSWADVSLRIKKPDGKYVYSPARGVDFDHTTVYFLITHQMTAAYGEAEAAVEIRAGGVLGIGYIILQIQKNPMPEDAPISQDEIGVLEDLTRQAKEAADRAEQAAGSAVNAVTNINGKTPTRGRVDLTAQDVGAAAIDDASVSGTATWSSQKIRNAISADYAGRLTLFTTNEGGKAAGSITVPKNGWCYIRIANGTNSGTIKADISINRSDALFTTLFSIAPTTIYEAPPFHVDKNDEISYTLESGSKEAGGLKRIYLVPEKEG